MSVNVNGNNDTAQEIQACIDAIEAQYQAAEHYITIMQQDASKLMHDETQLTQWEQLYHQATEMGEWALAGLAEAEMQPLQLDEAQQTSQLKAAQAKLEALDPGFVAMDNTIQSFLNTMKSLTSNSVWGDHDLIEEDMSHIEKYLNQLFLAMRDKLQTDMYQAIINNGLANNLSDAQLEQFAAQMIQSAASEEGHLGQFTSMVSDDVIAYNKAYDDANADYHKYNFFDTLFDINDANEKRWHDQQVMNNAKAMINAIGQALSDLAPELASATPAFAQVTVILKSIMKQVEVILAKTNISPKEKAGAILSLMMFALGVFNMINQAVQTLRSKNEQQLAQSNSNASQMNLQNSEMNQQIQAEERANAWIMKIVSIVAQVVLGSVMTLMAPGVGTAALMALVTTLQTTGALNSLETKLGELVHSQVLGDVLMGLAELAVTVGGGAIADRMLAAATKGAVAEAAQAAQIAVAQSMRQAAEEAVTMAGRSAVNNALERATATIDAVVQRTTQIAAQRTAEQLANQPLIALFKMLTESGREAAQTIMRDTAIVAARDAITEVETLAKLAARGIGASDKVIGEIASTSANSAAATASRVSVKTIESAGGSVLAKSTARFGWTLLYAISSSQEIQKELSKKIQNSALAGFFTFLQIMNQLMQMIALMAGSGIASGASFNIAGAGNAANMQRIANGLSIFPEGANAAAAYGNSEVSSATATAVTALAKNQTVAELLQQFLDQIQKDGSLARDRYTAQQQQELRSDQVMSSHLFDGDAVGVQILLSAAG